MKIVITNVKKQIESSLNVMEKERDILNTLIDDIRDIECRFGDGIETLRIIEQDLDETIKNFFGIV